MGVEKVKRFCFFLLSSAVMLSLGACSGDSADREYSLPDSVCDVSLSKKKYDPLFPPGEELETRKDKTWGYGKPPLDEGCQYVIDDEKSLKVSGGWHKSSSKEIPVKPKELLEYHKETGKEYPGRFDVWTGKRRAFAATECSFTKNIGVEPPDRYVLEVSLANHEIDEDRGKSHKVLGELAQSLMAGILPKLPCKES